MNKLQILDLTSGLFTEFIDKIKCSKLGEHLIYSYIYAFYWWIL